MYELIQKRDYYCPSRYVSGRIVEYDIRACNINMLYYYKKIDINLYNYLLSLPKIEREMYIGRLEANDSTIYPIISNGAKEFKVKLASANNIKDDEIVRIANDAVYINRPIDLAYTIFDNIEFRHKDIYSSAIKFNKFTIVFVGDGIIDVKGLGDSAIYHQNYMLSIIYSVINTLEKSGTVDALSLLNSIYKDYINLNLDKEYYREFNSQSMYKYKNSIYSSLYIEDINDIDIGYNLYILRTLWSIIMERS